MCRRSGTVHPQTSGTSTKSRCGTRLKLLWNHREIIYTLAERDFRAQYKQATLGMLWAVLSPVATLIALIIVFSKVHLFKIPGVPYGLYAYCGVLCWSYFRRRGR